MVYNPIAIMPILNKNKRAVMQKIVEEADLDGLLAIIDRLDTQTRAEVLKAIGSQLDVTKKNNHLASIRRIIQASDTEIKDWIVTAVVGSYASGSNAMYADMKKLSVDPVSGEVAQQEWTAAKIRQIDLFSLQKEAVNALISETYLDFANGMNGLVKGVEHQLNDTMRRQIRAQQIAGQITGTSIRDIAKEIESIIGNQGFSVLTDRGGGTWSLRRYSEMLARTHIIKSANEGAIARALTFGVDIMQVSTHPNSCDICKPYEGKVYSISGKSEKYPKLDTQPPYHPHCRHTFLPRPDLGDISE